MSTITRSFDPLRPDEGGELGRFLAGSFGASGDLGPHSPEVLLWKYFDPCGYPGQPRSFVARGDGPIIGHVGLCPATFVGGFGRAETFHMIDWLGSASHRGLGSALMRHIHQMTPTQYAFGTTAAARRSFDAAGYERLADVPVFRKVLRAGYRLRAAGAVREVPRRCNT